MISTNNSTTKSTFELDKKVRDVYSQLTERELEQLKQCIDGYGWLADSARRTGLHVNTLRTIIRRGYGLPETITKIRNVLLS